jgi:hypothetical protein
VPLVKPSIPIWQPGHPLAQGCKLYLPFSEMAGAPRDQVSRRAMTTVGSPTWGAGPYGASVSGFSTSNYYYSTMTGETYGSIYPCYMAVLCAFTATPSNWGGIVSAGHSALGHAAVVIQVDQSNVYGVVSNSDGNWATAQLHAIPPLGQINCYQFISFSSTRHEARLNGKLTGTLNLTRDSTVLSDLVIGTIRRNTSISGTSPPVSVHAVQFGWGVTPDPAAIARDWLSGQFAAVRPRSRLIVPFGGTGGGETFSPTWAAHSNQLLGMGTAQ